MVNMRLTWLSHQLFFFMTSVFFCDYLYCVLLSSYTIIFALQLIIFLEEERSPGVK